MALDHTGSSGTDNEEHLSVSNVNAKRVVPFALNTVTNQLVSLGGGLIPLAYDYILPTYNSTSDVYQFFAGGSGGTLSATVTIDYTDNTKATIQSVART
jgi:hypothetical protein